MKVLSLWEPWASLMAVGAKRIETRSWSTDYRGWLAIHAAKRWDQDQRNICWQEPFFSGLGQNWNPMLGHIVGVVKLTDCIPTHELWTEIPCSKCEGKGEYCCYQDGQPGRDWCPACSASGKVFLLGGKLPEQERAFGNYEEGRYAWVTEQAFRLPEPIPFKGSQGLRDLPADVVFELRRQWKETAA